MDRIDRTFKLLLLCIVVLLGVIAFRPYVDPPDRVLAQSAQFDHVSIISTMFLYKGLQGLLLLDRRNGDVWFLPKSSDISHNLSFQDPIFLARVPLEKLDHAPR